LHGAVVDDGAVTTHTNHTHVHGDDCKHG
jgi:hypothetical protein